MEDQARRCAEEFVRANGYTDRPPTDDSTRWVRETDDRGPWPVVLAGRIGNLEWRAAGVQCSVRRCVVLFRLVRPTIACGFRIVTMTQVFTRITLHAGGLPDPHCGERRA